MNTKPKNSHIKVRGLSIEVVRKDIKHFYISVHPPNGQVRVSTPMRLDDDAVRMAIISRLGWIRRKQTTFMKQERQSQREYVSGESHYFAGKRYRLKVTEQDRPPTVCLLNNTRIGLVVRPGTDRDKREAVLYEWYREHLRIQLPPLIATWEQKMELTVNEVRIKKMKRSGAPATLEQNASGLILN